MRARPLLPEERACERHPLLPEERACERHPLLPEERACERHEGSSQPRSPTLRDAPSASSGRSSGSGVGRALRKLRALLRERGWPRPPQAPGAPQGAGLAAPSASSGRSSGSGVGRALRKLRALLRERGWPRPPQAPGAPQGAEDTLPRATPAGRAARARVACPRVRRGHLGGPAYGGVCHRPLTTNTTPRAHPVVPDAPAVVVASLPIRAAAACGRCAWPSRRAAACHRPWGSARSAAPTGWRSRVLHRPAVRRD